MEHRLDSVCVMAARVALVLRRRAMRLSSASNRLQLPAARSALKHNQSFVQMVAAYSWYGGLVEVGKELERLQEITNELRVITLQIADVEHGVERPEIVHNEKDLSNRSEAASDDTRAALHRLVLNVGHAR